MVDANSIMFVLYLFCIVHCCAEVTWTLCVNTVAATVAATAVTPAMRARVAPWVALAWVGWYVEYRLRTAAPETDAVVGMVERSGATAYFGVRCALAAARRPPMLKPDTAVALFGCAFVALMAWRWGNVCGVLFAVINHSYHLYL